MSTSHQAPAPYEKYILTYPHNCRAKVYRLKGNRYDKVGDFLTESCRFDDLPCPLELDFGQVFRESD